MAAAEKILCSLSFFLKPQETLLKHGTIPGTNREKWTT
jgi:hypothetical protein